MLRNWHAHCPSSWPKWVQSWVKTPGSLTRRLVGLGLGFEVERVFQGQRTLSHRDSLSLGFGRPVRVRVRQVRLKVQGQPVVLAQTVVLVRGVRNDWPFWNNLGARSLGSRLFTDHGIRRGALRFLKESDHCVWIDELSNVENDLKQRDAPRISKAQWMKKRWPVRCARYERQSGCTPMWVFESFADSLKLHGA